MLQALPVMDLEAIWVAKRQIESQTEVAPPPADIEAWLHDRFVANHPMGLHRVAEQLLSEPDRTDELAALDLPVLVLLGEHDDVWPPALQAEMAARLGAAAAVLPDAGHSPAADLPEVDRCPAAGLLGRLGHGAFPAVALRRTRGQGRPATPPEAEPGEQAGEGEEQRQLGPLQRPEVLAGW